MRRIVYGFTALVASGLVACSSDDSGTDSTDNGTPGDTGDEVLSPDVDVLVPDTADTVADTSIIETSDTALPDDGSPPQPGTFGAACIENIDCFSGFCVTSDEGPVCTRNCVEDCPGGWSCVGITGETDVTFLCIPRQDRLCQPCALDGQCNTGYCVGLTEGNRCTARCDDDGECPDGYTCEETTSDLNPNNTSMQCVPANGACDCVPGKEGFVEACQNTNEFGSCVGLRTCLGLAGWGPCEADTAAPEACDGADNNCNRLVDENLTGDSCLITNSFGTCVGLRVCEATDGQTCVGQQPAAESCNYLDDDCDGATDNGFLDNGRYVDVTTCGNCFTNCSTIFERPNAFGVCNTAPPTPTCRMDCDPTFYDLNAVPDDGCEFGLDTTAIYVGRDSPGAAGGACGLGPLGTGPDHFPCQTIAQGLARAATTGRTKLIVADGLYNEQVTVANGVSLLGGYRADTWERHLASTGTIIRGPEGSGDRKAVIALNINQSTLIEGFVVNAANATSTGANSYAFYIRNSNGQLVVRDNLVFAGLGGPGSTGSAGSSGQNGVAGSNGQPTKHLNACSGTPNNPGGGAGQRTCNNPSGSGTTVVNGGTGGASVCPARDIQEGGGAAGSNSGGSGGVGGWGHNSTTTSCSPTSGVPEVGVPGGDATVNLANDGAGGTGCNSGLGSISGNEWRGSNGGDASHGNHGGGGGGGGAGSGGRISASSFDISGSGGGGGSGGCAGSRGTGGTPGGASIGIFILWTSGNQPSSAGGVPSVAGNVISRNQGGPGGTGGNGGAGGDPGAGGNGGALATAGLVSPVFCVFGGAKGGFGARGGHGGGAGGACGGVSFDVLAWGINSQPHNFASNTFPNGSASTGGVGGAGGNSSNTTRGGTSGGTGTSGTVRTVN